MSNVHIIQESLMFSSAEELNFNSSRWLILVFVDRAKKWKQNYYCNTIHKQIVRKLTSLSPILNHIFYKMVRQRKGEFQRPISDISKESSGSAKRKRKRKDEEEVEKLREQSRKCFKWDVKKRDQDTEKPISSSSMSLPPEPVQPVSVTISQRAPSPSKPFDEPEIADTTQNVEIPDSELNEICIDDQILSSTGIADEKIDLSNPSTWPKIVSDSQKKRLLISEVTYEKMKPSPIVNFWSKYYEGSKANGELFKRDWLRISVTTKSAFCLPCCFFSPTVAVKTSWSRYGEKGYSNFHNAIRGIRRHERGGYHLEAVRRWKLYIASTSNPTSLSSVISTNYQEYVAQWKLILRGIVDAVLFLAQNNLAFRGNGCFINEAKSGNFLNLIKLLGKYYTPLSKHVERLKKNSLSYLSQKIQNEFIRLLGETVKGNILAEIRLRKYFSILFDSTPDVSHVEQVSQIIRSVKCSKHGCEIVENFIDFISTAEKTGEGLSEVFLKKLEKDNLDIKNCRGQGYDNGANMAGIYKGVQARIQKVNSEARFVACAAHSSNLVGVNAAENVRSAKLVLGTVQNLYNFFSGSTARWGVLKSHSKITLKCQSSTRWSSKYRAVSALSENFKEVVEALREICNSDKFNSETMAGARSKLNEIMKFKFLLGLIIWNKILFELNSCNVKLQFKNCDVSVAKDRISSLLSWLDDFRINGFRKCLLLAKEKALQLGIRINSGFAYNGRRRVVTSKRGNSQSPKVSSLSNLDRYKINFFDKLVDNLKREMTERFGQIRECVNDFSFLWGNGLSMDFEDKVKCVKGLSRKYPNDFSCSAFITEIESLHRIVEDFRPKNVIKEGKKTREVVEPIETCGPLDVLNIIYKHGFENSYTNCETALRIFLTLPVSVASNERAFSKLKIIKNYLRSSMGQERLNGLAILSIEHEMTNELSIDEIINDFVAIKCRKVHQL